MDPDRFPSRDQLRELGYELGERAPGGASQGAWFGAKGELQVVLKWCPGETMLARYSALLPSLRELQRRGAPVPSYLEAIPCSGGVLSAQSVLRGRSQDRVSPGVVAELWAAVSAQAGLPAPPPPGESSWGAFVARGLADRADERHEALRSWSERSKRLLERVQAAGVGLDPAEFPSGDLVHLDLHTDNVLVEGDHLTGIVDWEGACAGDLRYDLVQFAFDLEGHGQSIWERVAALELPPRVLRAYVALLVLKCTSSAIWAHPHDVPRQLERGERVLEGVGG